MGRIPFVIMFDSLFILNRHSVIVNNFNVSGAVSCPDEAQAPLLADANAVLAHSVPDQKLKMVAGR